jgi:hypothetical protein
MVWEWVVHKWEMQETEGKVMVAANDSKREA